MPKVKYYSAPWLSKSAPGHQLFEASSDTTRSLALSPPHSSKKKAATGPRRTIARRGTEVFVAVGRDIRWADLAYLKEEWSITQSKRRRGAGVRVKREDSVLSSEDIVENESVDGFRVIRTPVADDIQQLVISHNANYLAILTTHTIHICTIPDSSHLTSEDPAPLKPKIFTLGPTTHVTSRSPIMSALWHPLGVNGSCVVTITADAVVRLWELSTQDRWSFDSPTTSVDLKKLADGTTLDEDFSASIAATNKAFSPDSFEMEVATASFPGQGTGGWSSMTLWVAMRGGDVYALCPLLPQRWAPPPTLIPSLSVSIVTTVASIEDDPLVEEGEKLLAQQQLQWMGELDSQEPQIIDDFVLGEPPIEVFTRPSRPGIIPRLQGPFELISDPETGDDLDTSITDMLVIGKKVETDELMMGEDEDLEMDISEQEGLSLSVICLLSTSGQVRLYLDLEGIQAQWLPPKNKLRSARAPFEPNIPALLAFQAIDTMTPVEVSEEGWPLFSTDVMSRYSFFVTHHAGITSLSLAPWVFRLEAELQGDSEAGNDFRLGLLVNSQSARERLYAQPTADVTVPLTACVVFRDPDLGYLLLSADPFEPIAITFETPETEIAPLRQDSPARDREVSVAPLDFNEPRPVYHPPHVFGKGSDLPILLERLRTSRHKTTATSEVKLSPLTLQIFTDAHKILSEETHQLGVAAAEIFRRCELLQSELRNQVRKANEVKLRVDMINGTHRDGVSDNAACEQRIAQARRRQEQISARVEKLRKTVGKATTRPLSNKERAFVEEVRSLDTSLTHSAGADARNKSYGLQPLWKRVEEVERLKVELVAEAETLKTSLESESPNTPELKIPRDIRRTKLQQVQGLLTRETALVEAVTSRLEKLQTSV